MANNFTVCFTLTSLIDFVFANSSDKHTLHYLPSTKQQIDKDGNKLVTIVEPRAAEETAVLEAEYWTCTRQ